MKKFILIFFFLYYCFTSSYIDIPKSSFRIRVIANSNSSTDVINKQIIYNSVIKKINNIINNSSNLDESYVLILNNKKSLNNNIKKTFIKNNIKEKYKIYYGYNFFPEKKYKNNLYKSGSYRSLVIIIGNGKGKNCWCSIYPETCFITKNNKKEYRFLIKDILFYCKKKQVIINKLYI